MTDLLDLTNPQALSRLCSTSAVARQRTPLVLLPDGDPAVKKADLASLGHQVAA